jgi:hypothetical protein
MGPPRMARTHRRPGLTSRVPGQAADKSIEWGTDSIAAKGGDYFQLQDLPLYQRVGGDQAMEIAVDVLYQKMLGDELVGPFFKDVDMEGKRLKQKTKDVPDDGIWWALSIFGPGSAQHPQAPRRAPWIERPACPPTATGITNRTSGGKARPFHQRFVHYSRFQGLALPQGCMTSTADAGRAVCGHLPGDQEVIGTDGLPQVLERGTDSDWPRVGIRPTPLEPGRAPMCDRLVCQDFPDRQACADGLFYGGHVKELKVVRAEFSEANTEVIVDAVGARGESKTERWRCLASSHGKVADLSILP